MIKFGGVLNRLFYFPLGHCFVFFYSGLAVFLSIFQIATTFCCAMLHQNGCGNGIFDAFLDLIIDKNSDLDI